MSRSRSPARYRSDARGWSRRRSRSRSVSPHRHYERERRERRYHRNRSRSPRRESYRRSDDRRREDLSRETPSFREHEAPSRSSHEFVPILDKKEDRRGLDESGFKWNQSSRDVEKPAEHAGSEKAQVEPDQEEMTGDEEDIMSMMGIPSSFGSTKGKQVEDPKANVGDAMVRTKRQARQYMNRRGGFNRPLPSEKSGQRHLYGQ